MESNLTNEEMKELTAKAIAKAPTTVDMAIKNSGSRRNFILIGTGDGGCNIANAIHAAIPETCFIAYNTTNAIDAMHADLKIIPTGLDGSGKVRKYSQEVFKQVVYEKVLEVVTKVAEDAQYDYIMIVTTTDGGTGGGVSPMMVKLLKDNLNIPVMMMGVYPSLQEDSTAQCNAMKWQSEVEKIDVPYIILDNNDEMVKLEAQKKVNAQAVEIAKVLVGQPFGSTNLSAIDNRDMYMLMAHMGKRICAYITEKKPAIGESPEDTLIRIMGDFNEPKASDTMGYGLFVKAPAEILNKCDTSLSKIRAICGDAPVQYTHMEESPDVTFALICAGCAEATPRIEEMRKKYDSTQANRPKSTSSVNSLLDDVTDPFGMVGGPDRPKTVKKTATVDTSALDL